MNGRERISIGALVKGTGPKVVTVRYYEHWAVSERIGSRRFHEFWKNALPLWAELPDRDQLRSCLAGVAVMLGNAVAHQYRLQQSASGHLGLI
jgi:hypothetical protein